MTTMTQTRDTRFWDRIAERYSRRPVPDEAVYQKKLEITRSYLSPEAEVLEVGCGMGTMAVAHAPFAAHIRATDFSPEMIAIGKRRAADAGVENVTFETVSAEALEAEPESYDVILALSLLHLVKDREAVLRKLHGMLKPGGVLITSTVCLTGVLRIFGLIAPIGRAFGRLPMLTTFSPDRLTREIETLGLQTERRWLPGNGRTLFLVSRKPG